MLRAIPATLMRGGTSKGLYLRAGDLPSDRTARDRVLLAAMGSPDARQIDGMGGAHPLTSKIAVLSPASRPDADVDYLFLQVVVDRAEVSDAQNCGNILAGVGPWAIENGLVSIAGDVTPVRIHMVNTQSVAVAHVPTPRGAVEYQGDARIDGVPGTGAAITIDFLDVAGSSCGALFPTGRLLDCVDGVEVTCVDNGMPVVILRASDFGKSGAESPQALEADHDLRARIEQIRLELGPRMNLGDVAKKSVPKMSLVSPARNGGAIDTRTFIPHRVHEAIGVLGAVSVATAVATPGSVAAQVAGLADLRRPGTGGDTDSGATAATTAAQGRAAGAGALRGRSSSGLRRLDIEHPSGFFTVEIDVTPTRDGVVRVNRSALVRTARKLMSGEVYVPAAAWCGG